FRVEQEFPPLKTSSLEAAEALLRKGNLDEARDRYQEIREAFRGRYEGLAAELGIARCHIISGRDQLAIPLLRDIETLAPTLTDDRRLGLLSTARFLIFLSSARLNHFGDAARALADIAKDAGSVSPAWVWHVPRLLQDLVSNRAYDEALQILGLPLFGADRATLHDTVLVQEATALERTLAGTAQRLVEGFGDNGQADKVKATFTACPMPVLADSFAHAVDAAVRLSKFEDALSLLAFCTDNTLATPSLTKAVLDLGASFCQRGHAGRLPELYAAFPEARLQPLFLRGIVDTTKAGKLADASRLLETGLRTFPGHTAEFSTPAIALGHAFVEQGDVLKPIALHRALGDVEPDASLIALLASAADKASLSDQPEDALRLLEHTRRHFGSEHAKAAQAAARLFRLHAQVAGYDRAATVYAAYPNSVLAPLVAGAIADAADDHLTDALALFGQYARDSYPVPEAAVRRLASSLARLDPTDDVAETHLDEYRGVYEAYANPAARASLTQALGDAYIRTGRLAEAESQYRLSGSAQGLLRAACLATERQEMEDAVATWQALLHGADEDGAHTAVAGYMLGGVTQAKFEKSPAVAKLPPPLVHYLTGLRLWARGSTDFPTHFGQAQGGAAAWFTPLATRDRQPLAVENAP
ncbi:hypothetical protein HQ560_03340, partial [bacterium]|nr:hypothetical protein [bacterium]